MTTHETTGAPQRNTRQRAAVLDMLDSLTQFTSAQDIHARLRDAGSTVGLNGNGRSTGLRELSSSMS